MAAIESSSKATGRLTLRRTRRRTAASGGFSLVEVLVVVAIIGLLAGLLFPVLAKSRRQGDIAQTTAHMRQLAVATALYQQTHEGYPPMGLDTLVDTRVITDTRLLLAKGDPSSGLGSTAFNCSSLPRKVRHATSFDDIFVYR